MELPLLQIPAPPHPFVTIPLREVRLSTLHNLNYETEKRNWISQGKTTTGEVVHPERWTILSEVWHHQGREQEDLGLPSLTAELWKGDEHRQLNTHP